MHFHSTSDHSRPGPNAFTLMEVLIFISIAAILTALLFPAINRLARDSLKMRCLSNLRQIGGAFHLYAGEHNGWFPEQNTTGEGNRGKGLQWDAEILPYLDFPTNQAGEFNLSSNQKTVLFCPASKPHPNVPKVRNLSYGYNRWVARNIDGSRHLGSIQNPSRLILAADTEWVPGSNESYLILQGQNNAIWIQPNSAGPNERLAYDRHGGLINVLFANGSVASRPPVGQAHASGFEARFPQGILWSNGGVMTFEAK